MMTMYCIRLNNAINGSEKNNTVFHKYGFQTAEITMLKTVKTANLL